MQNRVIISDRYQPAQSSHASAVTLRVRVALLKLLPARSELVAMLLLLLITITCQVEQPLPQVRKTMVLLEPPVRATLFSSLPLTMVPDQSSQAPVATLPMGSAILMHF